MVYRVAPAPIPDVCFWKWANGFMTPTVIADDLPYWTAGENGKPHLIVPYTLDANDMRFSNPARLYQRRAIFSIPKRQL